jgi:hypothetical protein
MYEDGGLSQDQIALIFGRRNKQQNTVTIRHCGLSTQADSVRLFTKAGRLGDW